LHLDVKPSNVLLTSNGRPMLLDFNLSRRSDTGVGLVGGTVPYTSPEQLRDMAGDSLGTATQVDIRSDVYSLGAVLYELLSGQLPFDLPPKNSPPVDVLGWILEQREAPPPSLSQLNANVDRQLASVIERSLAFDPNSRFPSASDFAQALRNQLSQKSRTHRWAKAHPR